MAKPCVKLHKMVVVAASGIWKPMYTLYVCDRVC